MNRLGLAGWWASGPNQGSPGMQQPIGRNEKPGPASAWGRATRMRVWVVGVLVNRTLWGLMGLGLVLSLVTACETETQAMQTAETQPPPSATQDDLGTLIAMQVIATDAPTATPVPSVTPSATPTDVPDVSPRDAAAAIAMQPSMTPTTPAPVYPTNTPRSTPVTLEVIAPTLAPTATPVFVFNGTQPLLDHYWLARPFPRDPTNNVSDYASRNYPYGSTSYGQFRVHTGVDMSNPLGTFILAVADGWVVYAGSDAETLVGPKNDFYGNVVVLEHDITMPDGRKVYTVYGHMSRVSVEEGQRVAQGEAIGQVGATGIALGSHLHLEVRLGDPYDYGSTYNPDLWLRPWPRFGTLAGRIVDRDGRRVYDAEITIQSADGSGPPRNTFSYADDTVNPDPYYGEHYTRGDLPAGEYTVFVRIQGVKRFEARVTVEAGQTTWLDITLN